MFCLVSGCANHSLLQATLLWLLGAPILQMELSFRVQSFATGAPSLRHATQEHDSARLSRNPVYRCFCLCPSMNQLGDGCSRPTKLGNSPQVDFLHGAYTPRR